jgi:hypothetical protein
MVSMICSTFGNAELIVLLSSKMQKLADVAVIPVLYLVFFNSLAGLSHFEGLFVAEVCLFL